MNAEPVQERLCETCRFWDRYGGIIKDKDGFGLCRRFPPTTVDEGDQYPETCTEDWCGEWKQAATTPESIDPDTAEGQTPDRGDGWLNAITEAQCETLRRSVDAFFDNVAQARKEHRDYTWSQFQDELNELRKVAKRDRDALGDKYIEIAALNGIVKVREDQVAELERKLAALKQQAAGCEELDELRLENTSLNQTVATLDRQIGELNAELSRLRENDGKLAAMNEFVEGVLNEASKSPELYGPFVRLVQDLDAKVGAK